MAGNGSEAEKGFAGKVEEALRDEAGRLLELGRKLASMPEPGFREFRTAELLARELADCGASVETGIAVTGLRASLGPASGPEIVLVADLDALPPPARRNP